MNTRVPAMAGALALLGALAVAGYLKWDNDTLRRANTEQAEEIALITAANRNQQTVITALQKDVRENAVALVKTTKEKAELRGRARHFERRAQEALHHVSTITVTDPWPVAVRNALCLRWLAAENRLPAGYDANGAALTDNAGNDPVARFCAAWNGVTPADTVIWAGALLDHIGELSIDRDAVRTKGEKTMGKTACRP